MVFLWLVLDSGSLTPTLIQPKQPATKRYNSIFLPYLSGKVWNRCRVSNLTSGCPVLHKKKEHKKLQFREKITDTRKTHNNKYDQDKRIQGVDAYLTDSFFNFWACPRLLKIPLPLLNLLVWKAVIAFTAVQEARNRWEFKDFLLFTFLQILDRCCTVECCTGRKICSRRKKSPNSPSYLLRSGCHNSVAGKSRDTTKVRWTFPGLCASQSASLEDP